MGLIVADNILQDFCSYCNGDGCDGGGVGSIQECESIRMLRDVLDAQPTVEAIPVEEHENKLRDLEWTIEWLMDDIVMLQEEVLE